MVTVEVVLVGQGSDESLSDTDIQALCVAGDGVRLAAKVTDMPCSEMHTDAFLQVGIESLSQNLYRSCGVFDCIYYDSVEQGNVIGYCC